MNKIKKLNLKKQLLSLKYCYEEQLLEQRVLISKVHNLENLFKLTKQFIREKKSKNFNFDKEKRNLLIISQKKNLLKNKEKQSKTLQNSILYNKYEELQKQKESLIQMIEEKSNILKSLKNELNINKIYHPYGFKISKIYLNDPLDTYFAINFNNIKNNNNITNKTNNNGLEKIFKNKFNNLITKEKLILQKKCLEKLYEMRRICYFSQFKYKKMIEDKGFNSCIKNKKFNKTFIFTVEPIKDMNNNSSNDSESESNNIDIDNKNNDDSDSINDHCFDQEDTNNNRRGLSTHKKNKNDKIKFLNNKSPFRNDTSEIINKADIIKNIFNPSIKLDINNMNISTNFSKFKKNGLMTEYNNERCGELNRKLLKIKENYFKCLDQRYELKNELKSNISQIYKMKEKIKKNKKQINNIDFFNKNK